MRTAIYARLSSASEDSVSIARQIQACEDEAERRGWRVILTATDDGVSALKVKPDERAGWKQIADRYADLDAVLYWKTDRLARRVVDFYNLAEETRENGVALVSVTEPTLDLSTSQGRAFAGMLAIFAEMEGDAISSRIRAAKAHMLREGRVVGGQRPWPFEAVKRDDGPGMRWQPIPERADAIKWAAAELVAGRETPRSVGREWDRRGLAPKKAGDEPKPWNPTSVWRLLRSPTLYGAMMRDGEPIRNDDQTVRTDPRQTILDRVTWNDLQKALDGRAVKRRTPSTSGQALLFGVVICDACEHKLYSHRPASGPPPSYKCINPQCDVKPSINMANLDAHVMKDFRETWDWIPEHREIIEHTEPDPEQIAELTDALASVQEALDATDDDEDALELIRRRRTLRERLAAVQDAAGVPVVRKEPTGRTVYEAWEAADDHEERRKLVIGTYGEVRIKKGVRGRRGFDKSRVTVLGPSDT